jgi:hypothetical protein
VIVIFSTCGIGTTVDAAHLRGGLKPRIAVSSPPAAEIAIVLAPGERKQVRDMASHAVMTQAK